MATVHRATILSFDLASYTAMVLLDGSESEAQVPVSQWCPPAHLVAGVEVGVILFDPTNLDDGMVLGAYGQAPDWTLPALNLGTGSGAAAGEIRASGGARFDNTFILGNYLTLNVDSNGNVALGVNCFVDAASLTWNYVNTSAYGGRAERVSFGPGALSFYYDTTGANPITWGTPAFEVNVSSGAPLLKMFNTQLVAARRTGWAAATNTKLRTTFDTTTVTLPLLAARVGALIDDLIAHGLIGA